MTDAKFPTEVIDLPTKGWFYSDGHPLSSGKIDIKYMTAHEEDILTSRNLIQKGIVIDKLLEALIVDPTIKLDDLLLGDKAAIMVASRILGYGKDYEVQLTCPECNSVQIENIDLQNLRDKECPFFTTEYRGKNQFTYQLPISKKMITFKFLTHLDEKAIAAELEMLRKTTNSDVTKEITTRLKKSILSVDGEDGEPLRKFIETMPARDAMAFRQYLKKVVPDIDLSTSISCNKCGHEGRVEIPIDVNFFWPSSGV